MHAPRDITLQCPVCGTWFVSTTMDEPDDGACSSADFHRRVDGPDPLAHRVHQCAGCDYAGVEEDFPSDPVTAASVAALASDGVCVATSVGVAGSVKYEAAATIAEHRGDGPYVVADLLLRAAWCCVGEQDAEAERFFRRKAARAFESALERYDEVPAERRAELTYLVGELWRRSDDDVRARLWLDRVADEVTDEETQGWLVRLAVRQRDDPSDWLC